MNKIRFDNFVSLNRGFDLPDDKIVVGEYPVIASTSIKAYHNQFKVKAPIVVTGRSGSLGKVQYIEQDGWPLNTSLYAKDYHGNYPKYVYYFLQTMHLEQFNAGVGVPTLNQNHLHSLKLLIHERKYQEVVANILSRYDEAIENNNKRIKLLEQMAQNLYKEWFVRFRFPGYENCEFENGMPVGWKVEKLGNFCKITDGTHDTPAQVEEGIPLVTGKAIRNGRIDFSIPYNISVEDHEKIKKRSGLKTGDILFSNIGTIGNVCLVNYDREFSVKNMIIFKPESINQSMYLFYLLNSDSIQSLFTAQTNGASQQFLGLDFMRRFKILLPSEEIIKLFGEKEVLIIQQINIFQQQNQNLAKQRDLLLPRLMSGKLEVE